jgi:hypothetical protein
MDEVISRQAAIDAIKALWNDAPSAQHMSAMFDCEDAIRVLPSAEPKTCDGCKHKGKWEDELYYGMSCPCINCKRRANDNYE